MSERQKLCKCFEVQICDFPETLCFRAVLEMQPRQCTDDFLKKTSANMIIRTLKKHMEPHVFHEKVSLRKSEKSQQMFQKAKTLKKLKTFLASAQKHLNNEAERCRVSTCAKYVEQLRSLGNSTTSNILSTFHNMHIVVHISSFSVWSSTLGRVNTAIIARRHHTCAQL